MRNWMKAGLCALALTAAGQANAAYIGQSTGTITNGTLLYQGLGPTAPGSGIGTGRWTQGLCGVISGNTVCAMSGIYADMAGGQGTPGGGGSFLFTETWTGTGITPALARSSTPGNNDLSFFQLGSAAFTLTLTPLGGGAPIVSTFPGPNSLGFSLFYLPGATCTGLAVGQACGSGQVGLTPGATITGQVSLSFNIPTVTTPTPAIPEPGTWALMISGFGLVGAAVRRRRVRFAHA